MKKNEKHNIQNRWSRYSENVLRVTVTEWDDNEIKATHAGKILYIVYGKENTYLSRNGKGDWSYLKKILHTGATLNLVRIRHAADGVNGVTKLEEDGADARNADGRLYPELIIYEPDILINVTTVASCFEHYAESPFVNLITRIKPSEPTIPIHLGNLAGQFLDEAVNDTDRSFSNSFMHFFHANALGMVTCEDMYDHAAVKSLYDNAQRQQKIIHDIIDNQLPEAIGKYDKQSVVLEPTFMSEVLGIQGRLDFLYEHDGRTVIIEQKSGKGAFVPASMPGYDPERPEMQEKHAVQLLLYRALFIYEFQRYSDEMKDIFLLYSKYAKGLLAVEQMPQLMLRAIKMRNLLAWCELDYAKGGMRLLLSLTPDKLNTRGAKGKLWEMYTRPELTNLLLPIRLATDLERAYYLQMMTFITRENTLAWMGDGTMNNPGFSSMWNLTLDEKRALGNIYDSMVIDDISTSGKTIEKLHLKFAEQQAIDSSNFRIGDGVLLYPYAKGTEPDGCAQMILRASITEMNAKGITLRLRFDTTEAAFHQYHDRIKNGDGMLWAVEHDAPASTGAQYSGMHSFLSAPKERRDLLMCQREPMTNDTLVPRGEYGAFQNLVQRAKQSREIFLVIGPPGTGKTSYGMLYQLREELLEEGSSVLLLSYTNRAVDEICSKLVEDGIDFMRLGSDLSCPKEYHNNLFAHRVQSCQKAVEVNELISTTRVFCATTSSLTANISLLKVKTFSLAIVDEASQILEPHLIPAFCATNSGVPAIERFVLIGDHKQLPAVVLQSKDDSMVTNPELNAIGLTDCRLSLFERFIRRFTKDDGTYDPRFIYMLSKQGRMHKDIADFPNRFFYEGKLDIVPLPHQVEELPHQVEGLKQHTGALAFADNGMPVSPIDTRIAFCDVAAPDDSPSDMVNINEAAAIARMVVDAYKAQKNAGYTAPSIGVIVPYRNQTATVRNSIDSLAAKVFADNETARNSLHSISIDTVERYQGSQRDVIIYGFTVQKPYQLDFLTMTTFEEHGNTIDRKLNVAMTRARKHLIIVGNAPLLSSSPIFRKLIEYCRNHSAFFERKA